MPPDSPALLPSGAREGQLRDESLQSRWRRYRESDALDEAWCLSAALVVRGGKGPLPRVIMTQDISVTGASKCARPGFLIHSRKQPITG